MVDKFSHGFINSVYEFNDYTLNELICKLAQKMDEVITQSNESFNYLDWLKGQGLSDEFIKIMEQWKENGTLETLINEQLFNDLNTKIDNNKTESDESINAINERLDTIINKDKMKYHGYNFIYGDNNYTPTLEVLYNRANTQIEIGSNSVACVVFVYIDDSNWNFSYHFNINDIKEISEYLYSNGISTTILKVHWQQGNYSELDFGKPSSLFFNKLKTEIYDKLIPILKKCGLEYISITNEMNKVTNQYSSSECKTLLNNLINLAKSNNLKTISCFAGANEFVNSDKNFIKQLDCIGINDYPAVSYNGLDSNINGCTEYLKNHSNISTIIDIIGDKPLIITEVGCMDYIDSLSAPYKWDYSEDQQIETNGIIQNIYISSYLNYCDYEKRIKGIFIWESLFNGFRPLETTQKTLKERWKK